MSKKQILALFCAITFFSLSVHIYPAQAQYSDIQGHWAADAITRWSDYQVIQGANGAFQPEGYMTRAEMATLLVKLLGLSDSTVTQFSDIVDSDWYADAIYKCAAAQILQGSNGKANPNGHMTREEAAVLLCRALHITPQSGNTMFTDNALISDWALSAVKAMTDANIINGTGKGFEPQAKITRAAVMTILNKAIGSYCNQTGAQSAVAKDGITVVSAPNVTLQNASTHDILIAQGAADGTTVLRDVVSSANVTVLGGNVQIEGSTSLSSVTVGVTKGQAVIDTGCSIQTLTANAPNITIQSSGTLTKVIANAEGVTVNGKAVTQANTSMTGALLAAPLEDGSGIHTRQNIVQNYALTTSQSADGTHTIAKFHATNLQKHQHGTDTTNIGYWVGIAVPAPAGANPLYTKYSIAEDVFASPVNLVNKATYDTVKKQDGSVVSGDYLCFYIDCATQTHAYLNLEWRDSSGKALSEQKILLDASAVTKADSTLLLKPNLTTALTSSTQEKQQLVSALGLTASVTGTNMEIKGNTTKQKLAASNGAALLALNISDPEIEKITVSNEKESTMTYFLTDYTAKDSTLTNAAIFPVQIYRDHAFIKNEYVITLKDTAGKVVNIISIDIDATACKSSGVSGIQITSQPDSAQIKLNQSHSVSVSAVVDSGTLSYQWYTSNTNSTSNGTKIANATSQTYTVPARTAGTFYYYCEITPSVTSYASVTSDCARIIVANAAESTTTAPTTVAPTTTAPTTAAPTTQAASTQATTATPTTEVITEKVTESTTEEITEDTTFEMIETTIDDITDEITVSTEAIIFNLKTTPNKKTVQKQKY